MVHESKSFRRIPFLACLAMAARLTAETPVTASQLHATHILGFADMPKNAAGNVAVDNGDLTFEKSGRHLARIAVKSIQAVSIGELDRQTGGVPLAIGKAATPYGGGRLIALFAHKEFDTLTLEYKDSAGAIHEAIFQLEKGKGEALKQELTQEAGATEYKAQDLNNDKQ